MPFAAEIISPPFGSRERIREKGRSVSEQERLAADADISFLQQDVLHAPNEIYVVFRRMALRDQDVVLTTVPSPRPVFVRPTDTEREIWLARFKHPANWQVQKNFATKPIIIEAKSMDSVQPCQFSLL